MGRSRKSRVLAAIFSLPLIQASLSPAAWAIDVAAPDVVTPSPGVGTSAAGSAVVSSVPNVLTTMPLSAPMALALTAASAVQLSLPLGAAPASPAPAAGQAPTAEAAGAAQAAVAPAASIGSAPVAVGDVREKATAAIPRAAAPTTIRNGAQADSGQVTMRPASAQSLTGPVMTMGTLQRLGAASALIGDSQQAARVNARFHEEYAGQSDRTALGTVVSADENMGHSSARGLSPIEAFLENRPHIKNLLIISGPGGDAFDGSHIKTAVKNFQKFANVKTVGDGGKSISLDDVTAAIHLLRRQGPIAVIVNTHGSIKNGKHALSFGGSSEVLTKDLLLTIKNAVGPVVVDYFMTACHGGTAQVDAMEVLPKGSVFVSLSPGGEGVSGFDVDRFISGISESNLVKESVSADRMLNEYLLVALKNRIAPNIALVGQGDYALNDALIKRMVGHPFSNEQRARIRSILGKFFVHDRLDYVIRKIETSKDLRSIDAVDFGPALAVTFAAQ